MKRRIISVCCAVVMIMGLTTTAGFQTNATESQPINNHSYLTHETESTGIATSITRGADLQTGYSKIVRLGPGVIYAGGTTIAQHEVESVKVGVMVERAKDENDTWHYVDTWQKENENAISVSSNKRIEVEGDWYYRVRCVHSAGNDMSSSYTNGIYIEEP